MKIVFAPMFFHPRRVLWINNKFRRGNDRLFREYFGFGTGRVIARVPGSLKVFDPPKIKDGTEQRPFRARNVTGRKTLGVTLRDPCLCPGCVAWREVPI